MRRALFILMVLAIALSGCGPAGSSSLPTATTGSQSQNVPAQETTQTTSKDVSDVSVYNSLSTMELETAIFSKEPVLSVGFQASNEEADDLDSEASVGRLVGEDAMPAVEKANLNVDIPVEPASTDLSSSLDRDRTRLLVKNDFEDNDPGSWAVGSTDGITIEVADGRLVFNVEEGAAFSWPTEAESLESGSITAKVEMEGEGDAGVIARLTRANNKTSTYVCWIHTGGMFGCQKAVKGAWHDILSGESTTIRPNKLITIQLRAVADELEFRINGKVVGRFADDTLTTGMWGVIAGAHDGPITASFDEISISEISDKPAPTPSPTPSNVDGNVIVDDDFEDGDQGSWPTGTRDYNSVEVEDGRLAVWVKARPGTSFGYYKAVADETEGMADGSITVEVEIDGDGLAGVIARTDADDTWDHYICAIVNTREYACGKLTGQNDELFEIALSGRAGAIKPNATNEMMLMAEGDTMTFSINGKVIGSFSDSDFEHGSWGIYAGAYAQASSTAYFDRITITER